MLEIFIHQSFDLANGNKEILRELLLLLFGNKNNQKRTTILKYGRSFFS